MADTEGHDAGRDPRLAEAIAQHPRLWEAMGQAWRLRCNRKDAWSEGQCMGFLRALCIVGGFDQSLVANALAEDFG